MYHSWLDRWDERRTRRADDVKEVTSPAINAELAFPAARPSADLDEFCRLADQIASDATEFYNPANPTPDADWKDDWITFPSGLSSGFENNDTVQAKVTRAGSSDHALVVFHHWNADKRNNLLARFFAAHGLTVVEIAMPYHLERSRPGSWHADYMLSPDLGRTVQAVRQAVVDGRQLVSVLQHAGYRKVSLLGLSLGSWVAGLIAAHEPMVDRAALFLTGGSLADMVWTGSATRHIHASLEGKIALSQLRRAWAPLSLETHAAKLARDSLALQLVLAERDEVVLPEVSERLISKLDRYGAPHAVKRVDCGHYSLKMPQYMLPAGLEVARFLKRPT